MRSLFIFIALLPFSVLPAQDWKSLYGGRNLDGWEAVGEGLWKVLQDGTLLGYRESPQRNPFGPSWPITQQQYFTWRQSQAWLYTKADYGEYDLHLEYLLPSGGNGGISIRDTSRARYSYGWNADFSKTPSHVGYEIQIVNGMNDKYPTGSIYLLAPAQFGFEVENGWNGMDIESRNNMIRISLNGHEVASHPGVPDRPKVGPIGLQLHDRFSLAMFRNIRIRPR
jgi:hypothetical protein